MSTERLRYPLSDWERVQRIELLPGVSDPEEYSRRVIVGMAQAQTLLATIGELTPTEDTIKALHYTVFRRVHPWAGSFRLPGQEVRAGNLVCSSAADVSKELSHVASEMRRYPFKGSKEHLSEIIAYYHAAFLAIHPFLDGNGRVARLITAHQMKAQLGLSLETMIPRNLYIGALERAGVHGDVVPLSKLLLAYGRKPAVKEVQKVCSKVRSSNIEKEGVRVPGKRKLTLNEALKIAHDSVPWYLTNEEACAMAEKILKANDSKVREASSKVNIRCKEPRKGEKTSESKVSAPQKRRLGIG